MAQRRSNGYKVQDSRQFLYTELPIKQEAKMTSNRSPDNLDLTLWPIIDHIQVMIELDRYTINTNILSKFEEDLAKDVAPRVYTRFF